MLANTFAEQQGELFVQRTDGVMYSAYPRTFMDANGDGHGDIPGIISKLDHLKSLGIESLWITPMYKSPEGPDGDGGYAVDDHTELDPKFGTLQDFRRLVEQAKNRNIEICMDIVLPHTSNTHEWFQRSRKYREPGNESFKDLYIWHPGNYQIDGRNIRADEARLLAAEGKIKLPAGQPGMPNNWQSVFGGPGWEWDDVRGEYIRHCFRPSQKSLNHLNPLTREMTYEMMDVWKARGVKKFRLDSVVYATHGLNFEDDRWLRGEYPYEGLGWGDQFFSSSICQEATSKILIPELAKRFRYSMLIGEEITGQFGGMGSLDQAADHVAAGLHYAYTTHERAIGMAKPEYIRNMLRRFEEKFPNGGLMFTLSDHDGYDESPRAYTRITERHRYNNGAMPEIPQHYKDMAYRQALQIYATIRGMLCLYQGDELGLSHARIPEDIPLDKLKDPMEKKGLRFCRDGARSAMVWDASKPNGGFSTSGDPYLPAAPSHMDKSVKAQEADPNSNLHFTRRLLAWRAAQPAFRNGKMHVLDTYGDTLAFLREGNGQVVFCAFNLGEQTFDFRPADVMDEVTLARVGLRKTDSFRMEPYGCCYAGDVQPQRTQEAQARPEALNTAQQERLAIML